MRDGSTPAAIRIGSRELEMQIRQQALSAGKHLNRFEVQRRVDEYETRAYYTAQVSDVPVRVGQFEDGIAIDLARDDGNVVVVTREGWTVEPRSPIPFRRSRSTCPMPLPRCGGTPDQLWKHFNVQEQDRPLLAAFLVQALCGSGPNPVLMLSGPQGSAKTNTTRMIKQLVDPTAAATRSFPSREQDLVIAAKNNHLLAFDNTSRISDAMSDALCRLSTGSALATRQLYTDADEVLLMARRPVILNGIGQSGDRQDLLDRSLLIELPGLAGSGKYRTEADIWRDFNEDMPLILGLMLDAAVMGLARQDKVSLAPLPRMADFAKWAAACMPAFGLHEFDFLERYTDSRDDGLQLAFESDPVAMGIDGLMGDRDHWRGSATELLDEIRQRLHRPLRDKLPGNPAQLTHAVNRCVSALRHRGVEAKTGIREGRGGQRRIEIRRIREDQPAVLSILGPEEIAQEVA